MSAARIAAIDGNRVMLERIDLLDGTPVLDLKPYLPYADAFPHARAGWVDELPESRSWPPGHAAFGGGWPAA